MLNTPSPQTIAQSGVLDHCNTLTALTLNRLGLDSTSIRVEATVRQFPSGLERAIFFGQEDIRGIVADVPVQVECVSDGSCFAENEPVLALTGRASDIALLRTSLTGVLSFYCSLITRMKEFVDVANPRPVHFFGLRKIHPSHVLQYLLAAYVAGMEVDATPLAQEVDPTLTLADCQEHLANIVAPSVEQSWEAFLSLGPEHHALHIVLDNSSDPVQEVHRAIDVLGPRMHGVLVDVDSTRRGHLRRIIDEVAWTLRLANRTDVAICLTGGVTPQTISQTKSVVASFGVGVNALQAPVLDFSFQVVEVEGKAKSKLGVLGGRKSAFVCGSCQSRTLALTDDSPTCCSLPMTSLLAPVDGQFDVIARRRESRERVLRLGLSVAQG